MAKQAKQVKLPPKDDLEKFPNTRRVLQLCELEREFENMKINADKECKTAKVMEKDWSLRENGRAWGLWSAALLVGELLDRNR